MHRSFIFLIVMALSFGSSAEAQLNVNINLGDQPAWGPKGYDHVDYYYLPDADAYYSVARRQFIYQNGNQWVFADAMPGNYNPYRGYKVVVNDPEPYLNHAVYKAKYARYKNWKGPRQVSILKPHNQRYKNNGPSPNPHQDNGNGKNKGSGNGKGRGNN